MEHWSKPEVKFDLMEYGWGSFEDIKIIALAYSKEELDILEGYWIKKTDSIINGYNINVPYLHKRKSASSNTRMSFSPSQIKK